MDPRDRIDRHPYAPWLPWAITSVALVLVAIVAYSIGAQQQAGGAEPVRRMWFGFPGFWVFILFWMFFGGLRRMFWWGGWGPPYRYYRPWRYGYYDHPHDDERAEWEAWHRREHERLDASRTNDRDRGTSSGTDRGPIT